MHQAEGSVKVWNSQDPGGLPVPSLKASMPTHITLMPLFSPLVQSENLLL